MSAPPSKPPAAPKVLGITGGIGSGKSTLAKILEETYQVPLIDADGLGHDALRPGSPVQDALIARFGEQIANPDGEIDRARLGQIVFRDPAALHDLNALVHPWIHERVLGRLLALKASGYAGILLLDAALLLDWLARFRPDGIVWVSAPLEDRLVRLERRGLARDEALRRIEAQRSDDGARALVDWVATNAGSRDELRREAVRIWHAAQERFGLAG